MSINKEHLHSLNTPTLPDSHSQRVQAIFGATLEVAKQSGTTIISTEELPLLEGLIHLAEGRGMEWFLKVNAAFQRLSDLQSQAATPLEHISEEPQEPSAIEEEEIRVITIRYYLFTTVLNGLHYILRHEEAMTSTAPSLDQESAIDHEREYDEETYDREEQFLRIIAAHAYLKQAIDLL